MVKVILRMLMEGNITGVISVGTGQVPTLLKLMVESLEEVAPLKREARNLTLALKPT